MGDTWCQIEYYLACTHFIFLTGRATSIAYVGPSVSPYYDLNLGYRIYYVDGDHETTTRVSVLTMNCTFYLVKIQIKNV